MPYRYRGITSRRLHTYRQAQTTASTITINGEVCVPVNNDGEAARGVKGGRPASDPFGFVVNPSTAETL